MTEHGRNRVIVDRVRPEVDGGRFAVKREVGDRVRIEADILLDGHDLVTARLLFRRQADPTWQEVSMSPAGNDLYTADFPVDEVGRYAYTVEAWVDRFRTWRRGILKKLDAGTEARPDRATDLKIGALLIDEAVPRAGGAEASLLADRAERLRREDIESSDVAPLLDETLDDLMRRHEPRRFVSRYARTLALEVDRVKARFSAWYELFPRSAGTRPGSHGTLKDVMARLPYVKELGFDTVYLPPIHPIGRQKRKGRNNQPEAADGDVGSPWAIGAREGGHKAIHPDLGTLEDFRALVKQASSVGIDIALDIAFQCAPDHPYVTEHPEWFRARPDGTIQYAENPPKRYEDIYPFDFESEAYESLWAELLSVFQFWIAEGITVFRVDNPHTKPVRFWDWVIGEVKKANPEVIFLSEAFTRPKMMYRLAKGGFTQSYTYFAWKNSSWDLRQYFEELTRTEAQEFFRPNAWPNTPDILNAYLQFGGRAAFFARFVLAATLSANYGIYGPTFELCVGEAREPGSEEYLDSEKYQLRHWELGAPHSLRNVIARVNRLRRDNPALQRNERLRFHGSSNDQIICYSKTTDDFSNAILVAVNLDPHHDHSAWLDLDLEALGVRPDEPFQVHDLLAEERYLWKGPHNFVELRPSASPAAIFGIKQKVRTERDFDYFM